MNPAYVEAPYEVAYAFWMPLPRNWANLGRKKRLKYIRFNRKKGKAFEQRFSRICPPRLTDSEVHDLFYDSTKYRAERPDTKEQDAIDYIEYVNNR